MPSGARSKQFVRDLLREIKEDRLSDGAASLAFYLMLAVFPAAIFLLTLLPFLPIPRLDQAIMDLLRQVLPGEAAALFTHTVERVTSERHGALLSVGLLFALWSASGGMRAAVRAVNVAYDIEDDRPFWKTVALSLGLTAAFAVLVVACMALVIFGGVLQSAMAHALGWSPALLAAWATFRWVVIAATMLLALSLLYHFGPNVRRPYRFVTAGGVFSLAGLAATSLLFQLYVSHFGRYDRTYGSLGAVVVLLMWLYLSGWVVLLGAEINALLAQSRAHDATHAHAAPPDALPA